MIQADTLWASVGVAQEERLPAALQDDYLLPFERSLEQEIAVLARIAETFAKDNPHIAQLSRLLKSEPAITLAELIACTQTSDQTSKNASEHFSNQTRDQNGLTTTVGEGEFQSLISRLKQSPDLPHHQLSMSLSDNEQQANLPANQPVDSLKQYQGIFSKQLGERLDSGDIDPATGLLIAAVRLLFEVKSRLNYFPAELLDHYYREMLGQSPRPAGEATLFLICSANNQPVDIAAQTPLSGTLADATDLIAKTTGPVRLVAARVEQLLQLRYWRNPATAPVNLLNMITGASAGPCGTDDTQLFSAAHGARMGLLIQSPVLALAQGEREIEIRIHLRPGSEIRTHAEAHNGAPDGIIEGLATDATIQAAFEFSSIDDAKKSITRWVRSSPDASGISDTEDSVLAAMLSHTNTAHQFRIVARRIVSHVLLADQHEWPSEQFLKIVIAAATRCGLPDPQQLIGDYSPADLFHLIAGEAFTARLSTASEMVVAEALYVSRVPGGRPGLCFRLVQGASAAPIEALPDTEAPAVELLLSPDARYSPVSLLEDYRIDSIDIKVKAHGLRRLYAFNDEGPVAVSQAVLPFGAEARNGAEFLIGAPELAGKKVDYASLSYTLTDLPPLPNDGSLDIHYEAYGTDFHVPDPYIETDFLNAEAWAPLDRSALINGAQELSATQRCKTIAGTIDNPVAPPRSGTSEADFNNRNTIRAGLLRLRLDTNGAGFGAEHYPLALADSIRKKPLSLRKTNTPKAPMTIRFTNLAIDYSAHSHIAINSPALARPRERVVQLGPFGQRELFPTGGSIAPSVLPPRLADGCLFIGLSPQIPAGPVSLLFDLGHSARERLAIQLGELQWHVLCQDGWQLIPASRLIADSSIGLQRSGVVSLPIPADVNWQSSEMPAGKCWLAVGGSDRLESFPQLRGVYLNGIEVSVSHNDIGAQSHANWVFKVPQAGTGEISQHPATGETGKPAEDKTRFYSRIAEGLHHRQRGVNAWDIERLVLEAFPQVWKCKCFPARDGKTASVSAGQLTLVVIPHAPHGAEKTSQIRLFDPVTLNAIQAMLQDRISAFAQLTVRNPSYEFLQIRARLKFSRHVRDGALISQLNQQLSHKLSVWTADAPMNGLGWQLNIEALASFARSQPDVEQIADFEVLHLIHQRAEERYRQLDKFILRDSVNASRRNICQHEIWSLPLSMPNHLISSLVTEPTSLQAAGIGDLAVGETLLVQ